MSRVVILRVNLITDVFVEYPSTQNVNSSSSDGKIMANPVLLNVPTSEINKGSLGIPIARPARIKK